MSGSRTVDDIDSPPVTDEVEWRPVAGDRSDCSEVGRPTGGEVIASAIPPVGVPPSDDD